MTDAEKKIINFLFIHPNSTFANIMDGTRLGVHVVNDALETLKEQQKVASDGDTVAVHTCLYWLVKDNLNYEWK